jgi:4-amino-4-deoxychorismate lyase
MQNKHDYIINGNVLGSISPLDRGLAYGDGVFRTVKIVDKMPKEWPAHYQKLVADCGAIGIVCPSAELLISDLHQLFELGEIAVSKIIITRGDGERGYAPPAITAPMRLVIKSPMPTYPATHYGKGVRLHVCTTRLAHQPSLAGIKHLNRLENVLARMEWHDPYVADGLMFDFQGHVIECTTANIFARFGDILLTPSLHHCGIAGITRQRILDFAYTLELKTKIESFDLKKLLSADEIIICNSLYGAWQVSEVQDKTWPQLPLAENIRRILSV